jgi:diphosphomevalonate decarboxylase
MKYVNPHLILQSDLPVEGSITWESPSNIAIIKYWGKHGNQLPNNPSLSFTLNEAKTITTLSYSLKNKTTNDIDIQVLVDDQRQLIFEDRIIRYLHSIKSIYPFLAQLDMTLKTSNTFPHSTGIASSASGFSALALCLCTLEETLFGQHYTTESFLRKASFLARLGSGSASRSIYPYAALWGSLTSFEGSNDEYAIPVADDLHPLFKTINNDILIIDSSKKNVSSTVGHSLMQANPYSTIRYHEATTNTIKLKQILASGDIEQFGLLLEKEALTLHALMMASNPPFILMKPNTIDCINRIQDFRKLSNIPVFFTLDAGPNIHIQYPDSHQDSVQDFIHNELAPLCEDNKVIKDHIGKGPKLIHHEKRT